MRRVTLARASCALSLAACLVAGLAAADAAHPEAGGGPPASAGWRAGPELRQGQIVIKRTGTRRAAATGQVRPPAPGPAAVKMEEPAELPYGGVGPRRVTIGYLVRDETETGRGPQVHCPAPASWGPYSHCGSYGYNSYHPGYVPHHATPCGGGVFFGSRPYYAPVGRAGPAGRPARWR